MMNMNMEEMNLLEQARSHGLVMGNDGEVEVEVEVEEEIDLEMGPSDDDPAHHFSHHALVNIPPPPHVQDHCGTLDQHQQMQVLQQQQQQQQQQMSGGRKKKRVVKKWRDEWAETYKWAYVALHEGTHRIFCSICKEYGRKHRRNPYGNEGSRNMQMSALEEHNNSLLHKEALRLAHASKDKAINLSERPVFIKALLSKSAESIVEAVLRRDPFEGEFIQAVQEIVHSLEPVLSRQPQFVNILERLLEPERTIIFRVPWTDDKGDMHVNRGYRVQFSQALGPYEGGLRFHPTVNLSIMKFLGLEQTFKNALTPLNLGGAVGGSDFDPRCRSENEVMRFCQSFMAELYRHIGPHKDSLDGDIGVGAKELGFLSGQYKRLTGEIENGFTGISNSWAGYQLRTQATGYGLVYFAEYLLAELDKEIRGLRCNVSGAGKVALSTVEKLIEVEAIPVTLSDSAGYLIDSEGFDYMKLGILKELNSRQKGLREYTKNFPQSKYVEDAKPWAEKCDVAFACASQNEINHSDAISLVSTGCQVFIEGSNMPCTVEATEVLRKSKVIIGPCKAANVGGAVVTMLEIEHRCGRLQLSAEDFDMKLQEVMKDVYNKSLKAAMEYGMGKGNSGSLTHGANIAAFLRITQALIEQGCV